MSDDELIAILRAEEADATSYYTSELATDQADAMDRYFGAKYGNEVQGRSSVTTHDIEDTINWMMPDLMRVFMSADDLISCNPAAAADEDHVDLAAQYLEHILFVDNPGATIIHDFAFDGLLQRLGVVSVLWQDPRPKVPELLEGVGIEQLMKLQADPEYKILEHDEIAGEGDNPQPTFKLKVQRTPKMGRVHIENIPPEEIALSRRARAFPSANRGTSQSANYVRRKQQRYLADVAREFPDFKEELTSGEGTNAGTEQYTDADPRVLARFQSESVPIGREGSNHELRKTCEFLTEYLWIDYDEDGIVELRRILRVGNTVLENLAVDDCEFKTWSPIRVAHRAIGRSIADTIIDLQKIRTTIMRLLLDGLSQSLVPRAYINTMMIDEEGIDDFLDAEVGGTVRGKGAAQDAISMLISPDVSGPALTTLEYVDQKSEQQSGVTRHSQGIAPDAITKTAAGIDMLQSAAGERIEMVARWLGLALEEVLKRALQLVVNHQDGARWVKIKGKPIDVDPRTWSDEMSVSVHVGQASASRQQQLANLGAIALKQEQSIQVGGPQNPVCDVTKLIYTYSRMTEGMGFRDAGKFWNTPDVAKQLLDQAAQQPPAEDPKMAEVKLKGQIASQELQQKAQAQQQEFQFKTQTAQAESAARAQADQVKAAADQQTAQIKANNDIQIARQKAAIEGQIAREKLSAGTQLAREKMVAEMELSREQMHGEMMLAAWEAKHRAAQAAKMPGSGAATDGNPSVRMGGKVG